MGKQDVDPIYRQTSIDACVRPHRRPTSARPDGTAVTPRQQRCHLTAACDAWTPQGRSSEPRRPAAEEYERTSRRPGDELGE